MNITTRLLYRNDKKTPLGAVTLAGSSNASGGCGYPKMRVLGSYAVVYTIDGDGHYADARGYEHEIRSGDLLLIFPDLPHRYGPKERTQWNEIYLCFEGPVFALWESVGLLRQDQPVHHLEPVEYWYRRFESVLQGTDQPILNWPLLQVCRLQQVLSEALTGGSTGPAQRLENQWVARAAAMLEADLTGDLDQRALARQMGMTYESFRKRFTHLVGVPPARYRAQRIIDKACDLMQQSVLTDKQIAHKLGFCDEFHFSRRFKQLAGCCPREFRRRLPDVGRKG